MLKQESSAKREKLKRSENHWIVIIVLPIFRPKSERDSCSGLAFTLRAPTFALVYSSTVVCCDKKSPSQSRQDNRETVPAGSRPDSQD